MPFECVMPDDVPGCGSGAEADADADAADDDEPAAAASLPSGFGAAIWRRPMDECMVDLERFRKFSTTKKLVRFAGSFGF